MKGSKTYVIGDVQGCYDQLLQLLERCHFNPDHDQIWFVGDLVNRGPASLEVLRWIYAHRKTARIVLGNHDLTLLGVADGAIPGRATDTFNDLLVAPDKEVLLDWLRQQPLMFVEGQYVVTHAGLYPKWTVSHAHALAKEVESELQSSSERRKAFFARMYGDQPNQWSESLTGFERLRFITNAFTRMRYLDQDGKLLLDAKGSRDQHRHLCPWFLYPERIVLSHTLLFGHWAALNGVCEVDNIEALDTGCGWGNRLTALCLETKERFSVSGFRP